MEKAEFETLLAPCRGALERFVYYKTPTKADGEDVLQDTLLAAYRRRDSLRNAESFKPWLMQIAANQIREFYRRRASSSEQPLDELPESALVQTRYGITVRDAVSDTLDNLDSRDAELLRMFYEHELPQQKIAEKLGVPAGTVKSRLHRAREHFRAAYPFPPRIAPNDATKGAIYMKELPKIIPAYTIEKSEKPPFSAVCEELSGWFIIPKLGEKQSWAIYDRPNGERGESYRMNAVGRVSIHGVEGVEITVEESGGKSAPQNRTFIAQLTDTHCRWLAESHMDGDTKRLTTFLDGDEFLSYWGIGEDNCGTETHLAASGLIKREGNSITSAINAEKNKWVLDIAGRYAVTIGAKVYDTVCLMNIGPHYAGCVSEQYLDENGRTVLWRRFVPDDWNTERHDGKPWSEHLPTSERISVNGTTYVHWYDCITDYIL
jgi:RNA polymerase sigma factor (sigma-70 family)